MSVSDSKPICLCPPQAVILSSKLHGFHHGKLGSVVLLTFRLVIKAGSSSKIKLRVLPSLGNILVLILVHFIHDGVFKLSKQRFIHAFECTSHETTCKSFAAGNLDHGTH